MCISSDMHRYLSGIQCHGARHYSLAHLRPVPGWLCWVTHCRLIVGLCVGRFGASDNAKRTSDPVKRWDVSTPDGRYIRTGTRPGIRRCMRRSCHTPVHAGGRGGGSCRHGRARCSFDRQSHRLVRRRTCRNMMSIRNENIQSRSALRSSDSHSMGVRSPRPLHIPGLVRGM
jgi:hypothetical protein